MESRCPKEHVQASIASSFLAWAQKREMTRVNAMLPCQEQKDRTVRYTTERRLVW